MNQIYDILIVGAGPAAIASILALPKNLSVAVATGKSSSSVEIGVHPKIRTVAASRNEEIGISRELFFHENKSGMLADTSITGGLTNYWGQQYVRYAEGDPWPRDIFSSYSEYLQSCDKVESYFTYSVNSTMNSDFHHEKYTVRSPRLLLGSYENPKADLYAMREVFFSLVSARGITVFEKKVLSWEDLGQVIRVYFSDGMQLVAKRIVLAAGVVGSLRLCMQSCADLQSVKLADHAPKLLYFLGTSMSFRLMRSDSKHFNSMTMEYIESERIKLLASFYHISKSTIGQILSLFGAPPFLSRTAPPKLLI
jgi:hypothetical protein